MASDCVFATKNISDGVIHLINITNITPPEIYYKFNHTAHNTSLFSLKKVALIHEILITRSMIL